MTNYIGSPVALEEVHSSLRRLEIVQGPKAPITQNPLHSFCFAVGRLQINGDIDLLVAVVELSLL